MSYFAPSIITQLTKYVEPDFLSDAGLYLSLWIRVEQVTDVRTLVTEGGSDEFTGYGLAVFGPGGESLWVGAVEL